MGAQRGERQQDVVGEAETLRHLLEAAAFAVFVVDETGQYREAYSTREADLGMPTSAIVGLSLRDLLPASRAAEVEGLILSAIDTGVEQSTDFPVEGPRGRLHLAATIARLDSSEGPRAVIVLRDMTAHEQIARELRESESRYRSIVDNAPEAIMVMDVTTGTFSEVNARAVEMFGFERERLLALSPVDLSPPTQPDGRPSAETVGERLAQAIAGERPVFEFVHQHSSGREFPAEIRLARLQSADHIAVRLSVQDISSRYAVQREMRECRDRCRRLAGNDLRAVHAELVAAAEQVDGSSRAGKRLVNIARALDRALDALVAELDEHAG